MNPEPNPYQPPTAELAEPPSAPSDLILVGSGRRFVNYLVDALACQAIKFVLAVILIAILGPGIPIVTRRVWGFLFGTTIILLYYLVTEACFARTLGKIVTGTLVVNEQGGRPSFRQILKRTFCRYIPFEPFSCFGKETRGWHDSLSETYVVKL